MGRWEPDAQGRLMRAALDLFLEHGFERTTVVDIAERAGVTERTFFRHFTDKREVLFAGSEKLEKLVVDAIASAPTGKAPIDVVVTGFEAAADLLEERREFSRRRAAAIAANPGLEERELLKMARLGAAAAAALRDRGVPDPAATLAAEAGITVFGTAVERWIGEAPSGNLARHIRDTSDCLRELTGEGQVRA